MKLRFVMSFCLMASAVQAQTVVPFEYILKVTPDQLNVISEGIATQAFNKAAPLIQSLREQILTQQQPKAEVPKPEEKK